MPSLSTVILIALGIYTACRFIIFPCLAWACSDVTLASIRLTSTHGIEWRPTDHALPLLRIEKAEWRWGGKKEAEVGWFVIGIKGVSVRVDQIHNWRKGKGRQDEKSLEEDGDKDKEGANKVSSISLSVRITFPASCVLLRGNLRVQSEYGLRGYLERLAGVRAGV